MFFNYRSDSGFGVHMLEVLLDERLEDDEQVVLEMGDLDIPKGDNNNFGRVNLGGGSKYMVATFDKFDTIKGYTMC